MVRGGGGRRKKKKTMAVTWCRSKIRNINQFHHRLKDSVSRLFLSKEDGLMSSQSFSELFDLEMYYQFIIFHIFSGQTVIV